MAAYSIDQFESERFPAYWPGIAAVAVFAFLLHALFATQYGYFRDELYYLACADRFAWGFVDHPPLSVLVLKISTSVFGEGLWGIRLPGFLAGSLITVVFALVARETGADEKSQVLASLFGALAPVILVVTHLYSMNGLDILLSALVVLFWIKASREESRLAWLPLGLFLGLALLNKLSALLLLAGLGAAMLLTPRRRELLAWHPWAALLLAALIVAPYALWLSNNGFVTFEFVRNATEHKMLPIPPLQFLLTQIVVANPFLFLLLVIGLFAAWSRPAARPQAIAFTLILAIFLVTQKSRENYLSPYYVLVAPVGAAAFAHSLREKAALRVTYFLSLAASSLLIVPLALPVLKPQTFIRLTQNTGDALPSVEAGAKSPLQGHADMFGWPEMAEAARQAWLALPQEEHSQTPVLGMNYGESSAVWFFNRQKDGPPVIGRHNNWHLWGPTPWDGKTLIIVGHIPEDWQEKFTSITELKRLSHPYAVPEEATAPVSLAKGLKGPVDEFWTQIRLIQ